MGGEEGGTIIEVFIIFTYRFPVELGMQILATALVDSTLGLQGYV